MFPLDEHYGVDIKISFKIRTQEQYKMRLTWWMKYYSEVIVKLSYFLVIPTTVVCTPEYTTVTDGSVVCTGNELTDECDFSCDVGYQLNGQAKLTCVTDGDDTDGTGQWDALPPTCERKLFIYLHFFVLAIVNLLKFSDKFLERVFEKNRTKQRSRNLLINPSASNFLQNNSISIRYCNIGSFGTNRF